MTLPRTALALATLLTTAPMLAQAQVAQSALEPITNQAHYWEEKGRYDLARESWLKLLRLAPDNESALVGLASAEAKSGRAAAAQVYLDRLRESHPDSKSISRIEDMIRSGAYNPERLAGPRALARKGDFDGAIAGYQQIYGNALPEGRLGLEYYQTLAGTQNGWAPARDGISALAKANPDEPIYQLALAQHLTYREETRREGLQQLQKLGKDPGTAAQAAGAEKQALLWLGAKPGDEGLYKSYLADHPDAQVAAKLEAMRNGRAVAAARPSYRVSAPRAPTAAEVRGKQVQAAYDLLNDSQLVEASAAFEHLDAANPNNDDILGGLGIVRLRQERYSEAREYLQRASSASPKRAGRWKEALSTSRFWEQVRASEASREQGEPALAEKQLRAAIAADPQIARKEPSVKVALADLVSANGDVDEAERLYREVLASHPSDVGATRGMVGVLVKRDQIPQALDLAQRLPQEQRDELGNLGMLKGQYLREQAKLASDDGDDAQAEQMLKQSLLEDPESPWTRLDLSRLYQQQKRTREANTLVDGLLTGGRKMPEALYIKALLLSEQNDWYEALQTLEQIDFASRTQPMADLQRRIWVRYQTSRAGVLSRYGRQQEALTLLRQVEPYAQNSPELLGSMAGALADVGEDGAALNYIRQALARQTTPNPGLRMQYASLLFKLRQDAEFEVVMDELVKSQGLSKSQSLDLANLRIAYRLRQADLVREEGNLARAYEYLEPLLKVNPNDPRLMMALARIYGDAKEYAPAAELYQRAIQTDPNNIDAYKGAIGAALSLNELDRADELIDRAMKIDPQNPRLYAMAASAARARGEDGRALQLYKKALRLDQERGAGSEFGSGRYAPQLYLLDPASSPVNRSEAGPEAVLPFAPRPQLAAATPQAQPVAVSPKPVVRKLAQVPRKAVPPVAAAPVQPVVARAVAVAVNTPVRRKLLVRGDYARVSMPRGGYRGGLIKVGSPRKPVVESHTQVAAADTVPVPASLPPAPSAPAPAAPAPAPAQGWVQTGPDQYSYSVQGQPLAAAPAPAPAAGPAIQLIQPQAPAGAVQPESRALPRYVPRKPAAPVATYAEPIPAPPPVVAAPVPPPVYSPAPSYGYPAAAKRAAQGGAPAAAPQPATAYPQGMVGIGSGIGATEQEYARQGLSVLPARSGNAPVPADAQPVAPAPYGIPVRPAAGLQLRTDPSLSTPDFALQRKPAATATDQPNEVLREIADINSKRSTYASFGLALRSRDGQTGLDKLTDVETPVEFSVAGVSAGRFKLRAVPVFLDAGTVSGQQQPLFGAMALVDGNYRFEQSETGIALGAVYQLSDFRVDFGSSPLGFPVETLVGGINWAPKVDNVSFKVDMARRSVTDSLLSYAGTRDPATGNIWGGVTKTGGRLDIAWDLGQYGVYVDGAYHVLDGENTARNSEFEAGGGFYARALDRPGMRVTYGVNLTTFFYDKNLRRFTYGQGGYFSPQNYFAVAVPVEWSGGSRRFSYKLSGAIGVQSFHEDASAAYPNDSGLQEQLQQQLEDNPDSTAVAYYSSKTSTGLGFNFNGMVEYLIAPNLVAGGAMGVDNARDYDQAQALGYIRYTFSGQRSVSSPPQPLRPYYSFGSPTQ